MMDEKTCTLRVKLAATAEANVREEGLDCFGTCRLLAPIVDDGLAANSIIISFLAGWARPNHGRRGLPVSQASMKVIAESSRIDGTIQLAPSAVHPIDCLCAANGTLIRSLRTLPFAVRSSAGSSSVDRCVRCNQ
jgi:hypothetical protein